MPATFHPVSPTDAHFNLANLLQGLGRVEDAVASYARALASNRDDAGAWNNLGVALERLGRRVDAVPLPETRQK